jgi:DNA polymerase-3 subunit alpha
MLWGDDYARYSQFLEKGRNLYITGSFRQRFNKAEFEFKVDRITMLENIKQQLTKQLVLDLEARQINEQLLTFLQENVKKHPGRSALKLNISEPRLNARVSLFTRENGFEMNDEMAAWLIENGDISVQVLTA